MPDRTQELLALARDRQNNRILQLSFPHGDAPDPVLLVNRFEGTEELSRGFEFTLEILSTNARLALKDFIGKLLSVRLARGDGTFRYFSGYIFTFKHLKSDDGVAFYEAQIGPWLRHLTLRRNNCVFHNQNLYRQTATVFQYYGALPAWNFQVQSEDLVRTMACQYDESDHNYLHRRWEAAGLMYWYEHTEKSHTLMLSDTSRLASTIDGASPNIPMLRDAGPEHVDGISDWTPVRQMMPTRYSASKFDFKNPRTAVVGMDTRNLQGDLPVTQLEIYEYAGGYGFKPGLDGENVVRRRAEEIEAAAKHFEASGNNRYAMPGRYFRLVDVLGKPIYGSANQSEFLIVSVTHTATNNHLQASGTAAEYSNELTCIRRTIPWRPGRGFNSVDTKILAMQTATIVGPAGQSIFTDEYGRYRIQFHWDLQASGDQNSSAFARLALPWTGGEQGLQVRPRGGTEASIQFLDGNPDHPVITGCLTNANNMPPWQLPGQQALTGFRSRSLAADGNAAGGSSNHLLFDDTANALQTQLRSDQEHSQLSLGSVARVENTTGRQDARGDGFELRTDAVGAIRSGKGMLVSTEVRPQAKAHISDVSEPAARLSQAQVLHGQLGRLAQQHAAQDSEADQASVSDTLKSQVDGIKGTAGGDGSFPELEEPHLLLAGAAGVAVTTPATAHVTGGQHVALTSGEDVSIAAGKSFFVSVSEKFSLFVHRMGLKLIAASGKVQIQAQDDELELLAKKLLSLISTTDWINLTAKQGIRLNGGGSELVISADGINGATPGSHLIHAASHDTMGPQSVPAQFPGADLCSSLAGGAAQAGNASVTLS